MHGRLACRPAVARVRTGGALRRNSAAALAAVAVLTAWLLAVARGCGSSRRRRSEGFHPKSIGVLPADVGIYKDAQGKVDGIITEVLSGRSGTSVIGGEEIRKRIEATRISASPSTSISRSSGS